jgi:rhodanese-related sulfurtransferase
MRFNQLIDAALPDVDELFPWDLTEVLQQTPAPMLLDIREPYEFAAMRMANSINVPRGILETACDWGYEETLPVLAAAREQEIIVICRSGNRSVLACQVMQQMGYAKVRSLKTGLRGWNDYEQPLINDAGDTVTLEDADDYFLPRVSAEQMSPKRA